jgi:hypothetical protein
VKRLLASLALGSVAACGSTVQVRSETQSADQGLGAPGTSAPGAAQGPGALPEGAPGSAPVTAPEPSGAVDVPGTVSGGGNGTTAPVVTPTGLPASTGPVKVGFQVVRNNASTASSFGFKLDNGDERSAVQALIAAANAGGGLAGHRIVPVWFEVDPATAKSYAQLGQEACSTFTEDNRVLAVAGAALFDTENACLSGRGIPALNGSTQIAYSEAELRRMQTVATLGITQRRQATAVVGSAAAQSYFSGRPKVGVISVDTPAFRDGVTSTLLPRLQQAGSPVDSSNVVYGPNLTATADVGSVASTMQSAVLRFRTAGVTHVVFLTNAASYALLFMNQADSQGTSFRYALSANDAPQVLLDQGVSTRQLSGAVAAGWDPYLDVRSDKVGTVPSGRGWCSSALKSLKLTASSNAEWIADMHCDAVQLLLAAGRQVTGPLSSASLVAALGRVGALPSANTWSAAVTADHRWAVNGYRLVRFDASCGCFSYRDRRTLAV